LKPSSDQDVTTLTITPEQAAQFKGRIPSGVKEQVLAINEEKRQAKKQLMRKDKEGAIVQQKKLDAFLEEFMKNGGNATEAAAQVFNVSSRASAATIGSFYLKKAKVLGRIYLEEKGYTYGRLLTIAAKKAEESRLPDWWDRVMEIADYGNFRTVKGFQGPVANINIMQSEKEIFKKYSMEAEVVEEEPEESKEFEMEESEDAD
jgi:ribosomal protein L18